MRTLVLTRELLELPQQLAQHRLRSEERFAALTERLDDLTRVVEQMALQAQRNGDDIGELKGDMLELRVRDQASAFFGSLVRRARLLPDDDLDDLLEAAIADERVTEDEGEQVRELDAVVRGRRDDEPVLLAVEISFGVGSDDVTRAAERAALLERTGASALPVVLGRWMSPEARSAADRLDVLSVIRRRPHERRAT